MYLNIVFDLILLSVQEGICAISSGAASITTSLLDKSDILKSAIETRNYIVDASNKFDVQGGAISDSMKGLVKTGKSIYSKAAPLVKKYGPKAMDMVKQYGPTVAKTLVPLVLGLGYSIEEADKQLGSGVSGMGIAGRGISGGAYIKNKDKRMKGSLYGRA